MLLYYSINCGKNCEYYTEDHLKEIWKNAKYYEDELDGYKVSNFGGIMKDGINIVRYLNTAGEICIKIDGNEIVLYKIVASTFLSTPDGGYQDNGIKKAVHHRDNNSFNFNPDNMKFLPQESHSKEPHLKRQNFIEWDRIIDEICKN